MCAVWQGAGVMTDGYETPLDPEDKIRQLVEEHGALDAEITAMQLQGGNDFDIMAMKRLKLKLKDEIAWLRERYTPDIIA